MSQESPSGPYGLPNTHGLTPETDAAFIEAMEALEAIAADSRPADLTELVLKTFFALVHPLRTLELHLTLMRDGATPEQLAAMAADDRYNFVIEDMPDTPPE